MYYFHLRDIIREFNLTPLTDSGNADKIKIVSAHVNRPGIHLLGFFDTFDTKRIQVFGKGEMDFLATMTKEQRKEILDKFFGYKIPCAVVARDIEVFPEMIEASIKHDVPLLKTQEVTSTFMSYLIRCLNYQLAPRTTVHGVHVDMYGLGVLIIGESGVGKSETALELVKRGHIFVADDAVVIKKASNKTLVCEPPDLIKNFLEIRGLGIIDVKNVFGVGAVKDRSKLNMVVNLETWNPSKSYDRLGIDDSEIEYLDIKVPCVTVPVMPGRNLAVIIEAAAMNYKQKNMGYNAAKTLNSRIEAEIAKRKKQGGK